MKSSQKGTAETEQKSSIFTSALWDLEVIAYSAHSVVKSNSTVPQLTVLSVALNCIQKGRSASATAQMLAVYSVPISHGMGLYATMKYQLVPPVGFTLR